MTDNYKIMQENARKRFLTYDASRFGLRAGVRMDENALSFLFLGEETSVSLKTGIITFPTHEAGFSESLTIYDWLCDSKENAAPSGVFAPVSSLPGVLVGGSGLVMSAGALNGKINKNPAIFREYCLKIGGKSVKSGDIGFEIPLFGDLTMVLKFYHGDEDFPASLTLLWDKNILQYIRYETVYYLAGALLSRLREQYSS